MSTPRRSDDRRRQARHYYPGIPVSWGRGPRGRWRSGRLHDVSHSGLALLTRSGQAVSVGDEIRLRRNGTQCPVVCRVVRMELRGGDEMLLACRLVTTQHQRPWLQPSPRCLQDRRRRMHLTTLPGAAA